VGLLADEAVQPSPVPTFTPAPIPTISIGPAPTGTAVPATSPPAGSGG
jgi:hypothetical protein